MLITTLAAIGASLALGPVHHGGFNLTAAHHKAVQYEQRAGLDGRVGGCRWQDRHDAVCVVSYSDAVVTTNGPATNYRALDLVTRSGACSNPGRVVSHHDGVTIQNGGRHYGNCFTGPLVAMPLPDSMRVA